MAGVTDNLPEVAALLNALARAWDFRGPGRFASFGEDALDLVAQGVYDRTYLAQSTPSGRALAPLAASTLRKKAALGYPETILAMKKEMGDYAEIQGERRITSRTASMTFGLSEGTRLKAEWNTEGDPKADRPPRPFYELDGRIEDDLDGLFEEGLDATIRRLGG